MYTQGVSFNNRKELLFLKYYRIQYLWWTDLIVDEQLRKHEEEAKGIYTCRGDKTRWLDWNQIMKSIDR